MKKTIPLLILMLVIFCARQQGVNFLDITPDEARTLAGQQNKMILIDFWTDG